MSIDQSNSNHTTKRLFHKARAQVAPPSDPSMLRVTLNSLQCQLVNLCDRPKLSSQVSSVIHIAENSSQIINPLATTLSPCHGIFPHVQPQHSSQTQDSSVQFIVSENTRPYAVDSQTQMFSLDQIQMAEQQTLLKEQMQIDASSIQIISNGGGLTEVSGLTGSVFENYAAMPDESKNFLLAEDFIKAKVSRPSRYQGLRNKRNSLISKHQRR